jgi:hypothetical protein
MTANEVDDRQHVAAYRIAPAAPGADGRPQSVLQFVYQEDEKAPVVLRQERLVGSRASLALELTAGTVRSWIGGTVGLHAVRGLRDGAPAAVTLTLPKDAVVERLAIAPKTAR